MSCDKSCCIPNDTLQMDHNFFDARKDARKQLISMWKIFARKHRGRLKTDEQMQEACKAFTESHAPELVGSSPLARAWRKQLKSCRDRGVMDAETFSDCNIVLEQYHKENSDPKA